MAQKWNLQDIRPAGSSKTQREENPVTRRTGQDISPRASKISDRNTFDDTDLATIDIIDGNTVKRTRIIVTACIALIIVGAGYVINILLGGADITVYPKVRDAFVQAEFTAYTNPKVDDLGYEILTLTATGEKQVQANGKELVKTQAEGEILVYNTKSTAPQRLIKNTRFESPEGLIFRIKESIEVPGATKDSKGNMVPGSVTASVFADAAGEKYNIGPSRFTVPGLKGGDQYDSVYGESIVSFSGGFEGEKYIIAESELQTVEQALEIELRESLLMRLEKERPSNFIVYNDAAALTFVTLPATEYGDSLATLKKEARLQVPIFKKEEFASFLANQSIPDYTGDPVSILNPENLSFTYLIATTTVSDIGGQTSLAFMLKGDIKIVWEFDEKKLIQDLLNVKKKDSGTIFAQYPSISNAEAEVRPFWENSFPSDPKEITVHTVIENVPNE